MAWTRRRSRLGLGACLILAAPAIWSCASTTAGNGHAAAGPADAEAVSLFGEPLHAPVLPPQLAAEREAQLARALADLERTPGDADALIWVGRRRAYLGQYREAIEVFSQGIQRHPDDPRFRRHRGHRWVTVRRFDDAIADFRRAVELIRGRPDEVEPDGLPNPRGIPTSTLHFNIWYHLGLAHYLKGELEEARRAYEACLAVSRSDDSKVATSHWLYMTLRRLGDEGAAAAVLEPIHAGLDVIESTAYLDLLLMYRGEKAPRDLLDPEGEDATLQGTTAAYGVGNWYLYNGDEARARQVFRRILQGREQWAAFGYIAAEADLARIGR